jgi:outer membrane lipoprotein SlyB
MPARADLRPATANLVGPRQARLAPDAYVPIFSFQPPFAATSEWGEAIMLRLAATSFVLALAACTSSTNSTYSSQDVGVPIETSSATVVSSRVVDIKGEPSVVGPAAGGIAGAATGGVTIGSGSGSTLAAVLGGLLGAGAGYLAEQRLKSREGIEYVLQMDDGRTITLVENRDAEEQPLPDGTPVLVQIGSRYSRVLEHPEDEAGGTAGDWVDPDAVGVEELQPADPATSAPPVDQQQ